MFKQNNQLKIERIGKRNSWAITLK